MPTSQSNIHDIRDIESFSNGDIGLTGSIDIGQRYCFISRVDTLGDLIWTNSFGKVNETHIGEDLEIYEDNAYSFGETRNFGGGFGNVPDVFIWKVNSSGQHSFLRTCGVKNGSTKRRDYPIDFEINSGGSIYILIRHSSQYHTSINKTNSSFTSSNWDYHYDKNWMNQYELEFDNEGDLYILGNQFSTNPSKRHQFKAKLGSSGSYEDSEIIKDVNTTSEPLNYALDKNSNFIFFKNSDLYKIDDTLSCGSEDYPLDPEPDENTDFENVFNHSYYVDTHAYTQIYVDELPFNPSNYLVCPDCPNLQTTISDSLPCTYEEIILSSTILDGDIYSWTEDDILIDSTSSFTTSFSNNIEHIISHTVLDGACKLETKDTIIVWNTSIVFDLGEDISICGQHRLEIDIDSLPILWSTGSTTTFIDIFDSGSYSVTLTDSEGCLYLDSINLIILDDLLVNSELIDNTCNSNGRIVLDIENGNPPYSYSWSNGESESIISGLEGGLFTVTVFDSGSCSAELSFNIEDLDTEVELIVNDRACFQDFSGTANTNVSGPNGPYSFEWNNQETSNNIFNLNSGYYSVTVTDSIGCETTSTIYAGGSAFFDFDTIQACNGDTVELRIPNTSLSMYTNPLLLFDNPKYYVNHHPELDLTENLTLEFWINPDSLSYNSSSYIIHKGSALLIGEGYNSNAISLEIQNTDNQFLNFQSNYSLPFDQWTHVAITKSVVNNEVKFYINGLLENTISSNLILTTKSTVTQLLIGDVFGDFKGYLDNIRLWNSTLDVQHINKWYNTTQIDSTHQFYDNLIASYTFDDNFENGEIVENQAQSIHNLVTIDPPDIVENSPWHKASDFIWSNGQNGFSTTVVSNQTIPINVMFDNGLISCQDDIVISGDYYYDYDLTISDPTCANSADGVVSLVLSPNCNVCEILWSNTFPIDSAGNYSVSITDSTGCVQTIDFQLVDPEPLKVLVAKEDETGCGFSDGTATAVVIGGTTPYNYEWSNNKGELETADSLLGGLYFVTVTDLNDCSTVDSINIDFISGTIIWISESDSWQNATNWDKSHAPLQCEDVILRSLNAQPVTITFDANYTSVRRSLKIEENVSLITNGLLSIEDSDGVGFEIDSEAFIINNGILNITQTELESILCHGNIINNGTINIYGIDPIVKLGDGCEFSIVGGGPVNFIKG
ncbi:MAG: hypothetical protein ACJATI_002876 [Halioglobus sp.]